ncbi:MAG: hypothetical protein QNK34_03170 [Woeseiaceae bacterium]|nr:hypothetical protein [Woeseiaceae bacterium]
MRYVFFIALFFLSALASADERMADVASYINAVWFAEEFNEYCPESPLEIPVAEVELRKLLVLAAGGNFVDEVAQDPAMPGINFRNDMKDLARRFVAEGCDSETASMLRARYIELLVVPDLIKEYQALMDAR